MAAPVVALVALVGVTAAVVLTHYSLVLRDRWRSRKLGHRPLVPNEADPILVATEGEISLAYDEALEMTKLLRAEWPHITPQGALVETALPDWRSKNTEFIGTVLGLAQRVAFKGSEKGSDVLERLESEGEFLRGLALTISADSIRVDEASFLDAQKRRREHQAASFLTYDHHRAPGAPGQRQFAPRNDAIELAQNCQALALSIGRWVADRQEGEAAAIVKGAAESQALEPDLDILAARRRAQARYDHAAEAEYAFKFRAEAKQLFDQAHEMGEIAKEYRVLALRPSASEFDQVQKLFDEIAESIRREAA